MHHSMGILSTILERTRIFNSLKSDISNARIEERITLSRYEIFTLLSALTESRVVMHRSRQRE